jgi:hypothetical protein
MDPLELEWAIEEDGVCSTIGDHGNDIGRGRRRMAIEVAGRRALFRETPFPQRRSTAQHSNDPRKEDVEAVQVSRVLARPA